MTRDDGGLAFRWAPSQKRDLGDVWHAVRDGQPVATAMCSRHVILYAAHIQAAPLDGCYRCRRCIALTAMLAAGQKG